MSFEPPMNLIRALDQPANRTPEDVAARLEYRCPRHPSKPGNGYMSGWDTCRCLDHQAAAALRSAESRLEKLKPYLAHSKDCRSQNPYARNEKGGNDDTCTCGLADLLEE